MHRNTIKSRSLKKSDCFGAKCSKLCVHKGFKKDDEPQFPLLPQAYEAIKNSQRKVTEARGIPPSIKKSLETELLLYEYQFQWIKKDIEKQQWMIDVLRADNNYLEMLLRQENVAANTKIKELQNVVFKRSLTPEPTDDLTDILGSKMEEMIQENKLLDDKIEECKKKLEVKERITKLDLKEKKISQCMATARMQDPGKLPFTLPPEPAATDWSTVNTSELEDQLACIADITVNKVPSYCLPELRERDKLREESNLLKMHHDTLKKKYDKLTIVTKKTLDKLLDFQNIQNNKTFY